MSTQKTGGLLAALGNKKEKAAVQQLEANETTTADKKAILFRLEVGDWRRLKAMAVDSDSSLQAMLEESVNEWLGKRGLSPIAGGRKK